MSAKVRKHVTTIPIFKSICIHDELPSSATEGRYKNNGSTNSASMQEQRKARFHCKYMRLPGSMIRFFHGSWLPGKTLDFSNVGTLTSILFLSLKPILPSGFSSGATLEAGNGFSRWMSLFSREDSRFCCFPSLYKLQIKKLGKKIAPNLHWEWKTKKTKIRQRFTSLASYIWAPSLRTSKSRMQTPQKLILTKTLQQPNEETRTLTFSDSSVSFEHQLLRLIRCILTQFWKTYRQAVGFPFQPIFSQYRQKEFKRFYF